VKQNRIGDRDHYQQWAWVLAAMSLVAFGVSGAVFLVKTTPLLVSAPIEHAIFGNFGNFVSGVLNVHWFESI
jgi:uncharacterized membrane protein YeiH